MQPQTKERHMSDEIVELVLQDDEGGSFPLIGEEFPEMEVKTTKGAISLPGDYKGKWFVLFSHPADFTPVCTTEFVAFQKRVDDFKALNCELIGLSIDQVFSHIKWVEWIKEELGVEITFPVIADDMGMVARRMGMLHPGKGTNTVRAVFIVDAEGIVRIIFYYPQELGRNMDEILRAVKGMQTSDENGVAIPAGWPDNELIKDEVIVPPATDVDAAARRKSEYDCYDWWFCHKKL
jgi:peroxiredoxin (alkyl hydroperoxide reductase subunit C)